ncbi:hypothetical protein ATK74_2162 [Propionicimonas paludicola]|uniref:Uncharacterized protein n=1 Tax=Propionicimonas paludicola TaxID=185243 RepID=A0A2A9CVH7_9ACTN|nr:hypothetical protein [Propionicimonas paludicola]PFG17589.1 hypothetical protein ATK74_2162 [Propionicimonas paludicola]
MSDEQAVTAAEREYQARLVALHEARAALASASARLRRQHLDRRLAATETDGSEAALGAHIEDLTSQIAQLRAHAEAQRQLLRRLTDADYEPIEVAEAELEAGHFEQPPFQEAQ